MKKKREKVLILFDADNDEGVPSITTRDHAKLHLINNGYIIFELQFNQETFINDIKSINPDVIFIAMHGKYGEDGRLQGMLDIMKIRYTHDNHFVCSICFNKNLTKMCAKSICIPVADWFLASRSDILSGKYLDNIVTDNDYIIKPNQGGSTVGLITKIGESRKEKINPNHVLKKYDEYIVEKFINGIDISVVVFNQKIVGIIELVAKDKTTNIISYEDKYTNVCDRVIPRLSEDVVDKLYNYSLLFSKEIYSRSILRFDFRVDNNDVFFLEINTHPGLGPKSMVSNVCQYNNVNIADIFCSLTLNAKYNEH